MNDKEQKEADEFCHKLAQELARKRESRAREDKTMSAIGKMVEWLEEGDKHTMTMDENNMLHACLAQAQCLLAKEQAKKPTADKGLVEELTALLNNHIAGTSAEFHRGIGWMKAKVCEILSRYKPPESVAELADKNQWILEISGPGTGYQWVFHLINGDSCEKEFCAKTYAEAESKARSYLDSLPDKKGEGK